MAGDNETGQVEYPTNLCTSDVRAAHLYNNTYARVIRNIGVAGLKTHAKVVQYLNICPLLTECNIFIPLNCFIQSILQFDGVYFQNLMERFKHMDVIEREGLLGSIQQYRIYADNL